MGRDEDTVDAAWVDATNNTGLWEEREWRGDGAERKGLGRLPAGVIRSDTERRQTAERRMFRRSAREAFLRVTAQQ